MENLPKQTGDNWAEYRRMVLGELERLNGEINDIKDKLDEFASKKALEDTQKIRIDKEGILNGKITAVEKDIIAIKSTTATAEHMATFKQETAVSLSQLTTKMGIIATVAGLIGSGLISAFVKFFIK